MSARVLAGAQSTSGDSHAEEGLTGASSIKNEELQLEQEEIPATHCWPTHSCSRVTVDLLVRLAQAHKAILEISDGVIEAAWFSWVVGKRCDDLESATCTVIAACTLCC